MKIAGWILTILAAIIIGYNVITFQMAMQDMRRNPMKYMFGGGPKVYSFTPPYSNFELLVLAAGVGGIILLIVSYQQQAKLKEKRHEGTSTEITKEKPEQKGTMTDS